MKVWMLRRTARMWNRLVIAPVMMRLYEVGLINSVQMHTILLHFDPTQGGVIGALLGGDGLDASLRRTHDKVRAGKAA